MRRTRGQRGEGNFGCLFALVLFAIGLFIAYKVIPVKVRTAELRQEVVDQSKSAGLLSDAKILAAILAKAQDLKLPVTEQDVKIERARGSITVDVEYTVPIDFPGYKYLWHLHHHAENPIF